jgi:hypothetical protein
MKNAIKFSLIIWCLFLSLTFTASAGGDPKSPASVSAIDAVMKSQVDSIKYNLAKEGFVLVKEALMPMESEYELPVIVPLNEGTWYHIVFIGDVTSKLLELHMFDFNEKQVVYQKQYGQGKDSSNIIRYSYIPKFSEYHIIKPVQVNKKKKNMNGYILMFKKIK